MEIGPACTANCINNTVRSHGNHNNTRICIPFGADVNRILNFSSVDGSSECQCTLSLLDIQFKFSCKMETDLKYLRHWLLCAVACVFAVFEDDGMRLQKAKSNRRMAKKRGCSVPCGACVPIQSIYLHNDDIRQAVELTLKSPKCFQWFHFRFWFFFVC